MSVKITTYYNYTRKDVVPLLPENYSVVLEIGCGTANFRENLKSDIEYWGIEPEKNMAMIAREKSYRILVGKYDDVYRKLPDNYFDLIICNDVIEHMADYDFFLQSVKRKMVKGSYIVASIPNVRYLNNLINLLIKKDWVYTDSGILDRTHLKFFTEKSIKK